MDATQESNSKEKPPVVERASLPEKTARSSRSKSTRRKSSRQSTRKSVFRRWRPPKPKPPEAEEDNLLTRHNAYVIQEQLKQRRYDKDADPMESPPLEAAKPLLGAENDATLLDVEDVDGTFTVELSELSEHEYQDRSSFFVRHLVERVNPALVDPKTRPFVLANITMLIGILFLVIIIVIVGNYGTINSRVESQIPDDVPCLFRYTEWTPCPHHCTKNRSHANVRSRTVEIGSIIQARGIYKTLFPCPHDLADVVETVPCNTHLCPRNLSEFPFGDECYFEDITKTAHLNANCYQVRNLFDADPEDRDVAVLIDDDLTRRCQCPVDIITVTLQPPALGSGTDHGI